MSHQDRLGDNGPETTKLSKPDEGNDRMEKKSENVAHARMVSNRRSSRIQDACGIRLPHGQLLAQGGILQGDLFLTAENKKNETNRNHNCIQHGNMSLRSSVGRIKTLRRNQVLANHRRY